MPKETQKKNNKGTKKATVKKSTPKKTDTKKVITEKVEVTEKKVDTKKVVKIKKEKKGNKVKNLINKVMQNTPFVISLCVIIILIASLVFVLYTKRIPQTSNGKEIVATIKGEKFTADDLYEALKEKYGKDTLVNLIDEYITNKEVQEFSEEDEEYVKEVIDYYKEYAEYYGVDLSTFIATYLGLAGIETEEEFEKYITEDYKKTLAIRKYIAEKATDKDLKNHYKENFSDSLTVKHILIEVDPEAEDAEKADEEAYNTAVKLIKKLKNTDDKDLNDKFEELVEDYSDDTETYSTGGLIEDFTKKDVVEEFWEASNELKDGKYTTKPIKTTYGYHIILKVSSTPVEKYEDIKDEVKKDYAENQLNSDTTLFAKSWDELRNKYKLSFKDDSIKDSYEDFIKSLEETKTEE